MQLMMIEGLPGTGKTTIAKWLYGYLVTRGVNAALLLEGNKDIPLDFLKRPEYQIMTSSYCFLISRKSSKGFASTRLSQKIILTCGLVSVPDMLQKE